MIPRSVVPLVRDEDLALAEQVRLRVAEFTGEIGALFLSVYARATREGPRMDVFIGHRGTHADKEVSDVVALFCKQQWPQLVMSISARKGALR